MISVIIPAKDSSNSIVELARSLINQTCLDFEVLLVFSGVFNEDMISARNLFCNCGIRYREFESKVSGIYEAMNLGVQESQGDWLYFIGDDDCLYSDGVMCEISRHIAKDPSIDFMYGNVVLEPEVKLYDGEFNRYKLIDQNICQQSIFYKKNLINRLGRFDVRYPILADYHFNMKCFSDKSVVKKYVDVIVARYNSLGTSGTTLDVQFNADKNSNHRKYFGYIFYFHMLRRIPFVRVFVWYFWNKAVGSFKPTEISL